MKPFKRLYATCAVLWKEDEEFWRGLAGEERRHAKHIRSMIAIITSQSGRFQPGGLQRAGAETFISGIERDIDSVQQVNIPEMKALRLALGPRAGDS